MKSEQAAFGERLKERLVAAGLEPSPAELARLLARHGGAPVSTQAISGWLTGKSVPRQGSLRVLAKLLKLDPVTLQYGGESGRQLREPPQEWKVGAKDQLTIDAYLALPVGKRHLIRSLIDALAEGAESAPAPGPTKPAGKRGK